MAYLPAGRQARRFKDMWYVYILRSIKNGHFYKGFTDDINDKMNRYFNGRERTTKIMLPLELIHVEICDSRKDAQKLEKFFKSGYGREIIKEIYINQ